MTSDYRRVPEWDETNNLIYSITLYGNLNKEKWNSCVFVFWVYYLKSNLFLKPNFFYQCKVELCPY